MITTPQLLALLDQTLNLEGRTAAFNDDTPLMGALPELDSMGVVALLTALEDQYGLVVDDEEIDGSLFATVGTLRSFVAGKLEG
ncbi:phosphopantetheine-containing protein [Burkholderiales bacterium JOSHI_001]|nr:phosphopantetheine-containing protein [Burkholderiales bacterium JOSHI_001]